MNADNTNSGNNAGPQQGGGNPNAGNPNAGNPNAGSTSTPANKAAQRVATSSASRPTRLAINETQVQDRQSGAPQNQFVERTYTQQHKQDEVDEYSDEYEVSDRGPSKSWQR